MAAADSLIGEGLAPSPYAQTKGAYEDMLLICVHWQWIATKSLELHGYTPEMVDVAVKALALAKTRRKPC